MKFIVRVFVRNEVREEHVFAHAVEAIDYKKFNLKYTLFPHEKEIAIIAVRAL